ncbi:MAG: hypothetical protein ACXAD7_12230 [Candidatus Kariarchaeaceae archaeon]
MESADFIGPGGLFGSREYPKGVKSSKTSYNEEDAAKLWEIS